jgi:hypothetical protein
MRWIDVPKTETRLIPLGLDSGFKLANIDRPWEWKNRLPPDPAIIVSYEEQPPGSSLIKRSDAFLIFISNEGNHYATVMGESPADSNCVATGEGGKIDVDCGAPEGGRLVLAEHYHPAWEATVNDETVQVHDEGTWLAVDLPGGPSHISLRYRPNDFWIGLGLSIIGLIWALAWLVSPRFSVIRTVRERRRIGLKPGQDSQSLV